MDIIVEVMMGCSTGLNELYRTSVGCPTVCVRYTVT